MTNPDIAAVFDQVADLLEFQNANPFRVRAYRNAARTIRDLGESAERIVRDPERSLTDIEGIGKDLAEKIDTLVKTGGLPMLDELLADVPESVLAILRVPGLGPKKAAALFRELKVASLDELRQACEEHRVRELSGFGEKSESVILQGLDIAAEAGERILWAEADAYVQSLLAHLRGTKAMRTVEAAGSYRRGKETVGDLDLLAVAKDAGKAMDALARYEDLSQVIARGDTKMSIRLIHGLQVDLRVVPEESFGGGACSISPARRSTTSCFAAGRRTGA